MFTYLTELISRFGSRPVLKILLVALAALIAAVLLTNFVSWLRRRRQDRPESWMGLLTSSAFGVLKVLAGLALLAALALHLRFSSGEFARRHGGTNDRNYNAVQTIWGRPHIQRELDVKLVRTTKKYFDKDGLEFDASKLQATSQLVAYREQEVEQAVPGNPVVEADHHIDLAMNYRKKGNGSYPGFDLACRFAYVVQNAGDKEATAQFAFPLPSNQGLVDRLVVQADGKSVSDIISFNGGAATWKMPLAKGQKLSLEIKYHSRGLDYVQLDPGAGRELAKYRVTMECDGIKPSDFNSPMGCMTPTRQSPLGKGLELEWNLDHAVTQLGMGIIVPREKQEGYYVARILDASPWALVLLMGMVLVSHLATGRRLLLAPLVLLALAFHLYYLLMANIGDYWSLKPSMTVAGVALTALMAWLWLARADRFAAVTTLAFFLVFCAGYPLIAISDHQGLLMAVLYVLLLGYVVGLLVIRRRSAGTDLADVPRAQEAAVA